MPKIKHYGILALVVALLFPVASFASTYSGNVLTGGTATDDVHYLTFSAPNAFDGNTATTWVGYQVGTILPHWVRYALPSPVVVNKISLFAYAWDNGVTLADFTFEGSNNGSDWYVLKGGNATPTNAYQNYEFATNTEAFSYYRFNVLTNYAGNNTQSTLDELEAYTCLDCAVTSTPPDSSSTSPSEFRDTAIGNLATYIYLIAELLVFLAAAYGVYKLWTNLLKPKKSNVKISW